jgi:hypothetical protein
MPEFTNDERKEKKGKYTCPCGFSSYDLMEFLKHPFMGNTIEKDEKALERLKEGEVKEGEVKEGEGEGEGEKEKE